MKSIFQVLCVLALFGHVIADEKPAAAEKTTSAKAEKSPEQIRADKLETIFNEFGFRLNSESTHPKIGEFGPGTGVRIDPTKAIISEVQVRVWKSSKRKEFKISKKYEVLTRDDLEKLLTTSQFQKATIIDFHYVMDSGEPSSFSFVRKSEIERAQKEEDTRVILDIPFGVAPSRSANGQ